MKYLSDASFFCYCSEVKKKLNPFNTVAFCIFISPEKPRRRIFKRAGYSHAKLGRNEIIKKWRNSIPQFIIQSASLWKTFVLHWALSPTCISWIYISQTYWYADFDTESDIASLNCKICRKYAAQIRTEARSHNLRGQILDNILSYVDGVTYVHKANVHNRIKAGGLHDWPKKKIVMDS